MPEKLKPQIPIEPKPEGEAQLDFIEGLKPPPDQEFLEQKSKLEERERQIEEEKKKKPLYKKSRLHKIEEDNPGVQLGSIDRKYHW